MQRRFCYKFSKATSKDLAPDEQYVSGSRDEASTQIKVDTQNL